MEKALKIMPKLRVTLPSTRSRLVSRSVTSLALTTGAVEAEHAPVAPAAVASVVWLGAACLCWFAQLNWTGPVSVELDTTAAAAAEPASPHARRADAEALESLAVNGEPAYALLRSPGLLRAARALLVTPHAGRAHPYSNPEPESEP